VQERLGHSSITITLGTYSHVTTGHHEEAANRVAGIIFGTATDGNTQLSLYCFDIYTNTSPGTNYALGTWNASNVPNVNCVAQVLNN
jgi:hypothetical protein